MDLTTSNHSGLSTHELFHKIRKDDDAMIRITVSQAPRKGEDAVKESSLLGEAIERNSHIQRLDIKLPRVIDFDRWQLFAKGIAGNSSIKTISFSWDVRGTIGLIHVLQYFGAFLEQNSRLEAFQVMAGQLVVNGEEMRTLLAPLSRRNHPLNSFRILCGGFVNQLMQVFVLVFSVNPSVTPKSIDITSSVEGAGHEREVLECLSKLSHTPYCTLESFGAPVNHVDRDAIKILAKLLSGNKTLTTIMLRTTENRGISHAEWQDLDNVLWDKSSLKATLNSNHTLCFLNLGRGTRIPADIGRTLELNLNGNKNLVARKKVFITHFSGNGVGKGALDELNAAFLVHIIAFFDRMLEETGVMAFLIYSSRNFRFTFLYQLLKRNPMLLNSFQ